MWESPVNIFEIHEPIVEEINKQKEEMVFKAMCRVGVDVDKEELLKALQYDRNQYEKGYADGYADAIDEFAKRLKTDYVNFDLYYILQNNNFAFENTSLKSYQDMIDEIADQMKGGE